ncbi:MAG TPA: hypothetical protein P5077_13005 [bacterium]|nr:hypothetical protein [bacterium]
MNDTDLINLISSLAHLKNESSFDWIPMIASALIAAGASILTYYLTNRAAEKREEKTREFELNRLDKQYEKEKVLRAYMAKIETYSEYLRRTFAVEVVMFPGTEEELQMYLGQVVHRIRLLADDATNQALIGHYAELIKRLRAGKKNDSPSDEEEKAYGNLLAVMKKELDNNNDFLLRIKEMEKEIDRRNERIV